MKHLSTRKLLITLITAICIFSLWTLPAQAAGVSKLCASTNKTKTFKKEITGDKKTDSIKLKTVKDRASYIDKLDVVINNKKALSIDFTPNCWGYSANYISMSKKNVFLQIYGHLDGGEIGSNQIYKYNKKTKKLVCVLDCNAINPAFEARNVTSASSSQIKIAYNGQPYETGHLSCSYSYVYKNGIFKPTSNTVKVKCALSGYSSSYKKYFKQNKYVAAKKLYFYSKPGMLEPAAVSFTANAGDVVQLKKVKAIGRDVYLQFKKGKATGWMKVFNSFNCFEGVTSMLAG